MKSSPFLRLLALLMCLLLPVPAALAGETPVISQDITVDNSDWLTSYTTFGDSVLFSGDSLWQWKPGEDQLTRLQFFHDSDWQEKYHGVYNLIIAARGDRLYGLSTDLQTLYDLSLVQGKPELSNPRPLDLSPLLDPYMEGGGGDEYIQPPYQMLVFDGRLYLLSRFYGNMGPEVSLVSYNLEKGGEPTRYQSRFIQHLAPYRDGRLLALVMDESLIYSGRAGQEAMKPSLQIFDPQTDTLENLGDIDKPWQIQGLSLAFDPGTDSIYLASESDIYKRKPDGKLETCAYLNPINTYGSAATLLQVMPDGSLVLIHSKGLSRRSSDPGDLPAGRLTIYGFGRDERAEQRALAKMKGVAVTFTTPSYGDTAQSLAQMLVGGSEEIDIFFVSSEAMDLDTLMKKGYTQDLSASAAIREHMDALYPMFREPGQNEAEQTMLVPVSLSGNFMSYYPMLFENTGLIPPRNYKELADFLMNWQQKGLGDQYPAYTPLAAPDFFLGLADQALQLYAGETAASGKPFSFADPVLQQMLQQAEALRTGNRIDFSNPDSMQALYSEMNNKAPLMSDWFSLDVQSLHYSLEENMSHFVRFENGQEVETGRQLPLLLSIGEGKEPHIPVSLTLMAVNPRSRHLEQAIRFVEAYAESLEPSTQVMLKPGMNEGIESPYLAEMIAGQEEYLNTLEDNLKKAEGAGKTQLEKQIAEARMQYEKDLEENRWEVSPEAIACYRALIEKAYVVQFGDLYQAIAAPDIQTLMQRYIQGQISLAQFTQEAEGKLRLMRLEGQ